jgi:hypothetical protein
MGQPHPFCKVFEEGNVPPSFHVRAQELTKFLVFCLFGVLEQSAEEIFVDNEILISFYVMYFDVSIIGVNAETKI